MFKIYNILMFAREYVDVERRKADNALSNHFRLLKREKAILEVLKTKDAPNIKGLIKIKEESIINRQIRIDYYKHRIKIINLIPIKRQRVFSHLLKTLNKHIIREVLKGGKYLFPLNVGKLYILVGDKIMGTRNIDWNRSMNVIHNIAKKQFPEIYADYKSGKLKQFEYMDIMKPHLFPTPGKPRWIILNDNPYSWWIVFKRGNYANKNKYFFTLKGTRYIKFKDKTTDRLKHHFNNATDVINSAELGFKDKVLILRKFFNEQKLYYNDISSDKW